MDAERDIMARLRGLASRSAPGAIAAALEALPRTQPAPDEDRPGAFLQRLRASGATTSEVRGRTEAVHAIAAAISARQPQRRFVASRDPRLAAFPWREGGLLPRFGVATDEDRIAVSYARCAIAETGTLCLWMNRDNPALNNLLCEHHIVLVDRGTLYASLEALWDDPELGDVARRPRGLMLISGPSSTADIAMELVVGAHGPRSLHVILLGPVPDPAALADNEPEP